MVCKELACMNDKNDITSMTRPLYFEFSCKKQSLEKDSIIYHHQIIKAETENKQTSVVLG